VALVNDVVVNHAIDAINARAFPPHADIQGVLVSKQKSVGNLRVELDGGAPVVSSADGSFTFTDVVRGVHHLSVRDQRMLICENCTSVDITPSAVSSSLSVSIDLDQSPRSKEVSRTFGVALHQAGAPIALQYHEVPCLGSPRVGCVTVRLAASQRVLSRVHAVTYYLSEEFQPAVVTRSKLQNRFTLDLRTTTGFTVAAKVFLKNGQVEDRAASIPFFPYAPGVGPGLPPPYQVAPPVSLSQLR